MVGRGCVQRRGRRGHGQREDAENQQQAKLATGLLAERLAAVFEPTDEKSESRDKQDVGQNRADDCGLHYVIKPRFQGEEDDEDFGQVGQERLQHTGGAGAESIAQGLDAAAHQTGEGCQCRARCDERDHRVATSGVQNPRGRGHADTERKKLAVLRGDAAVNTRGPSWLRVGDSA